MNTWDDQKQYLTNLCTLVFSNMNSHACLQAIKGVLVIQVKGNRMAALNDAISVNSKDKLYKHLVKMWQDSWRSELQNSHLA